MPSRVPRLDKAATDVVSPLLAALREELEIPGEASAAALAEAEAAAADPPRHRRDATDLALVTIDPPGARDLDQALHLARADDGYVLHYAIADPASFVTPGGALDVELHQRGVTYYGPDGRVGLHPAVLAEDAASLLPGQERPACLWRIELDAAGTITGVEVERATVRSRAQLTYEQAQQRIDDGSDSMLGLLAEVGPLRQQQEIDRGGASLGILDQEVVQVDGGYRLTQRAARDVEDWNAQLSLATGIAAATLMRQARVGVLRTLPPADPRDIERLRGVAAALGISWKRDQSYGEALRGLDASVGAHAAFLEEARVLFRGADYLTFDGDLPPESPHGAIAAEYAHVTAPLRRLVDRYGLEIALAACAGTAVPEWVRLALGELPSQMAAATAKAGAYERGSVDAVEAVLLSGRVGETFEGVVVDATQPRDGDESGARGIVVISEPAVRARVTGSALRPGQTIQVRLVEADPATRTVRFEAR